VKKTSPRYLTFIKQADYSKALIYKEINTINDIKDGVSKPYELSVPNEDLSKYG
jgi:hypothetical protein